MTTYAIAHLRNVAMGPYIVAYLEAIDATLEPYDGKFLIHGNRNRKVLEGDWQGDLVMIAFPDRKSAEDWYASSAYQAILPLRTGNSDGEAILVDGVEPGHRATDLLK
jgi:uncharacterized protein (DUF1330 family)